MNDFYDKLKHQKSSPIQKSIEKFIQKEFPKYANSLTLEQLGEKTQKFTTNLIIDFCKIWNIKLTYKTEDLYNTLCDNFEDILLKKLYPKIFCSTGEDKRNDFIFDHLLEKYDFITPKLLDIKDEVINELYLSIAINKLSTINKYKSPKDKLITFMNSVNILSVMYTKQSKKGLSPGADEIFPILVYTIIKGKIPKLQSNVKYYKIFRHHTRIQGNEEYYIQTFSAALKFIEEINSNILSVNKSEFENEIKKGTDIEKKKLLKLNNSHMCLITKEEILLNKFFNNEIKDISEIKKIVENTNTNKIFDIDVNKIQQQYIEKDITKFQKNKLENMKNEYMNILSLIEEYQSKGGKKNDDKEIIKDEIKNKQDNVTNSIKQTDNG